MSTAIPKPIVLPRRHLYGPKLDFLLLGGGSLLALTVIGLALGRTQKGYEQSVAITLLLANLINHPHFAQSYQIFYSDFGKKLTAYPNDLRSKYWACGIAAPLVLLALLSVFAIVGDAAGMGYLINLMFFMVGWHYVKQGYGMAMVDAAFKKAYYSEREKRALLINAYLAWGFSWLLIDHLMPTGGNTYWGIPYSKFEFPVALLWISGAALATSSSWLSWLLFRRCKRREAIALNGLIAYTASLYAWLLLREPIFLLWIPLFHSLQYMAVVMRYQSNRYRSESRPWQVSPKVKIAFFYCLSILLGYAFFWALPQWLDDEIALSAVYFDGFFFLSAFWIFINIHHYLLDTVMWRKGNPDVGQHLFQGPSNSRQPI